MIRFKNVSKIYSSNHIQSEVLKDISFHIEKGDIFGIIGPSGAGKSTLLRLINSLIQPSEGTVIVHGRAINGLRLDELRILRQKIGMVFQHFNLLWSRTVRENIAFPLEVAGKSRKEIHHRVEDLLERVGLVDKADIYPAQLSGGQKQRVGIARALANHPDILLCDEATSALDPQTTDEILQLLKDIHQESGVTMVIVTHDMKVIQSFCDKLAVIENGAIVEMGTVKQTIKNPQHLVTRTLLDEFLDHQELKKGG